jgi:hypothetical protein
MFDTHVARKLLISSLRRDAVLHQSGEYESVGRDYDSFDALVPRDETITDRNFWIALRFWDSWSDQCRHGFGQNFYRGIVEKTWPMLANEIASCLETGNEITNKLVIENFS